VTGRRRVSPARGSAPVAGLAAVLALAAPVLAGCATAQAPSSSETPADTTLTVFAAASLGDSFEEIATGFEAENPDLNVELNLAGSSSLLGQVLAGAPADVFAAADEPTMDQAVEAGEALRPTPFATNVLTLVTPPDNPAGLTSLRNLNRGAADGAKLVVCAPQVPCGRATALLAEDAGVELTPVSEESQVTDVLGKVVSGAADAGLVYATDALGAGDAVHAIELDNAGAAVNTYPIAVLAGSTQREAAGRFVDYVRSDAGRSVLAGHGFGTPPDAP
jgi:molybdate transport system substrate-binding protein